MAALDVRTGASTATSFSNFSKKKWIANQVNDRAGEFTNMKEINVTCGTWNVNAKKPDPNEDLLKWLHKDGGDGPDLFFIGFQEIVDLNAVNVVADRGTRERAAVWSERIEAAINTIPGCSYRPVHEKVSGASLSESPPPPLMLLLLLLLFSLCYLSSVSKYRAQHLVGIVVCIYAKEEHISHIKRVQSQTAGVGVMGMMGNKGGAAIRLKFHDTTMCLVAAHLAAHRDNVAGRNADFANILQRVQFVHVSTEHLPFFAMIATTQAPGLPTYFPLLNSNHQPRLRKTS